MNDQATLLPGPPPTPLASRDITPLTVLQTARRGWQARRKQWISAGIDDGDGRNHIQVWPTIVNGQGIRWQRTVSIFDPVLTETMIEWWTLPGDTIIDPCAGGPVRGIIAAYYGRHYIGVDISPQQVAANQGKYEDWQSRGLTSGTAQWIVGAAQHTLQDIPDNSADYILTCPPYHNLEKYTDHPDDLSTMTWNSYRATIGIITTQCARILKPDRWATWVTGDIRDRNGLLRRLPSLVDQAHEDTGMRLASDQIIASPLGGKYGVIWRSWRGRSATRIHQHAHTYLRGDRRRAATRITGRQQIGDTD